MAQHLSIVYFGSFDMKILVPSDGSSSALRAVKYAGSLRPKVSITLISVHDDTGMKHLKKFIPKDTVSDYLRELSDKDLKSARAALDKAGVPHDMIIKIGHVAEEIAKTAKVGKYDLIVMGAKGRSILSDMLIGSVAQRVLALTKLPLTFIK
jgi:nucleotide-binding universal stress UspA family protein